MSKKKDLEEPLLITSTANYYLTPSAGAQKLDVVTSTTDSPYVYVDINVSLTCQEPSIELESIEFNLTENRGFVLKSSSLPYLKFPHGLVKEDVYGLVLNLRIPLTRLSAESTSPGEVLVKWHRRLEDIKSISEEITASPPDQGGPDLNPPKLSIPSQQPQTFLTSYSLPYLQSNSIGLVAILETPPSCKLHDPTLCHLTIYNADPHQTVELDLQMDASDAFLTAGLHYSHLPILLPESHLTLEFTIVPMLVGMGTLPRIQVWRRTADGGGDSSNRALIPVIWGNESISAATGRSTSTMQLKVTG